MSLKCLSEVLLPFTSQLTPARARLKWNGALLAALMVLCVGVRADASTLTVTSLADSGPGSLRDQVAAATAGDTINFSVTGAITLASGDIAINTDLTITGPGAGNLTVNGIALIGGNSAPLFEINSGVVGISGLTLSNGVGKGIQVVVNGGFLQFGGAIYMTGGTVTITGTTFSHNLATYGGAFYMSGGTVTMTGTTFSNNTASSGGAIFMAAGSLAVAGSTLSNNTGGNPGTGGAIEVDGGSLAVTTSTISGNVAGGGGGIVNQGTVTIADSTISGNSSTNVPGYAFGGGILNFGGMTITNSTISGNRSLSVLGYPISGGGGLNNFATLTIANSTITANSAENGGGIKNSGTLNLSNTIVAGNTASFHGPDIYVDGGAISGDYNLVQSFDPGTAFGTHNITGQSALLGPLANHGGPTLTHAFLPGSPAIDAGDPDFDATTTPYDQRGIGFPRVMNGRINMGAYEADTFESGSGVIVNTLADHDDGVCGITDCTLREAVNDVAAAVITFSVTGTITLASGELIIARSLTITGPASAPGITVSGNNASRIFLINSGTVKLSTLTMSGGNGVGSVNSGNGGAVFNNNGTLTVTSCTISGNTAANNAGAIRNGGTSLTVTNSTISGNTATSGAAIRAGGTVTVTNSTIYGNSASTSGGGIFFGGTLHLSNSIVAGNSAPAGPDIDGIVTSGDYNLVQDATDATLSGSHNITGQAALLGPLANNGGPTQTHALLANSPALDAGDPAFDTAATPYDERGLGYPRKNGSAIDIGAFEQQPPASHFDVVAPSAASAGTVFSIAVTARDAFGNVDGAFAHAIHFSSGDPSAGLPGDALLTNGTAMFSIVLGTAGSQTITATDTTAASVDGTSNAIIVTAGAATHFNVAAPPSAAVGLQFSITVGALDQYENAGAVYSGTIHFTSSDASASLPPDSPIGGGTFPATLNTTGSHTITATDTSSATITGTSNAIVVCTFSLSSTSITAPSGGLSGSFNVTGGAACGWVAMSNAAWLTTTSTGTGNGPVSYTVAENPSTVPRIGAIVVGDRTFTVTQSGVLPTSLVAATDGGNASITLTWNSTAVDHYEIWRNTGSGFVLLTTGGTFNGTGSWAFVDNGVSVGAAYAYEVRAVDSGANDSDYSNRDLATTFVFTDDPLIAGVTKIKAAHITELQNALILIRTVAGAGSPSFTNTTLAGLPIAAADIEELRDAMDGALDALHIARPVYSTIDTNTNVIAAAITEIRAAMK